MRTSSTARFIVLPWLAIAALCGCGQSTTPSDTGGGGDTGTDAGGNDAISNDGGVDTGTSDSPAMDTGGSDTGGADTGGGDASGPCPGSVPTNGSACTTANLVCAYPTDPRPQCQTTATCTSGAWVVTTPSCAPVPPETCPATIDMASGQSCTTMDAICSYNGLNCTCTNCSNGPVPNCSGPLTWHCESPNPDPNCPAAIPELGSTCAMDGQMCMYMCGQDGGRTCQGGVWVLSNGGPCPVSTRRAKRDIRYLNEREEAELAHEVLSTRLASYEYTIPALAGRRHLGFIIEDQPSRSYAVNPEANQVDLYGYTSMLLATVQEQARQIAELQRQVRSLQGEGSFGSHH